MGQAQAAAALAPPVANLVSWLQKSRQTKDLPYAQRLLAYLRHHRLDTHPILGNYLVPTLVDCGCLADAQLVFDRLPYQNVYSWTSLVSGHIRAGNPQRAFHLHHRMCEASVQPNDYTYVALLKACTKTSDTARGRGLHADVVTVGLDGDSFIGNTLVDMYCKFASVDDACHVFEKLASRDAVSWTALIAGYAEYGDAKEALSSYKRMQLEGVCPNDAEYAWDSCTESEHGNSYIYVSLLKACSRLGDVVSGQKVHNEIIKKGLQRVSYVGSTLVDMYVKCGSLAEAQQVFSKLEVCDTISWNSLVAGYAEYGFGEEALHCFQHMQPDGVSPDTITYSCGLKACGILGAFETGQAIHGQSVKLGFDRDLWVGNTLVDMYGRCSLLPEAHEVFQKILVKDVVSWTAIMKGYCDNYEAGMAVKCFEDMQKQGVKPNAITFTCLFTACSQASLVVKGQEYFEMMTEVCGIEPITDHYGCMINLLGRSGRILEAVQLIESMRCVPSSDILRTLLTACEIHGEVELGLQCFQQLVCANEDDGLAYLLVADIYANAGKWSDAHRIEEMRKDSKVGKKLGNASIEINRKLHDFAVGDIESKDNIEILETVNLHLRSEGYVPKLDMVSKYFLDDENGK